MHSKEFSSLSTQKPLPACLRIVSSNVVIATRSHPTDAECLIEILNFRTKYVGMLGSTKKISAIVNYLQEKGYTSQSLARLKAPIGLDSFLAQCLLTTKTAAV